MFSWCVHSAHKFYCRLLCHVSARGNNIARQKNVYEINKNGIVAPFSLLLICARDQKPPGALFILTALYFYLIFAVVFFFFFRPKIPAHTHVGIGYKFILCNLFVAVTGDITVCKRLLRINWDTRHRYNEYTRIMHTFINRFWYCEIDALRLWCYNSSAHGRNAEQRGKKKRHGDLAHTSVKVGIHDDRLPIRVFRI